MTCTSICLFDFEPVDSSTNLFFFFLSLNKESRNYFRRYLSDVTNMKLLYLIKEIFMLSCDSFMFSVIHSPMGAYCRHSADSCRGSEQTQSSL